MLPLMQAVVPAAPLLRRQRYPNPTPPQHPFHPMCQHTPLACYGQVYAKGQAEEIMGKAFKVTRWLPACLHTHTHTMHTECTLTPSRP